MADEITIAATLQVENGNYSDSRKLTRLTADQATLGGTSGIQEIGTSYEAITLGDVSTQGYVYIRNTDTTNFVEIGIEVAAAFNAMIKLLAGEVAVFRAGGTLYAKADTAAVKIDKLLLEA